MRLWNRKTLLFFVVLATTFPNPTYAERASVERCKDMCLGVFNAEEEVSCQSSIDVYECFDRCVRNIGFFESLGDLADCAGRLGDSVSEVANTVREATEAGHELCQLGFNLGDYLCRLAKVACVPRLGPDFTPEELRAFEEMMSGFGALVCRIPGGKIPKDPLGFGTSPVR